MIQSAILHLLPGYFRTGRFFSHTIRSLPLDRLSALSTEPVPVPVLVVQELSAPAPLAGFHALVPVRVRGEGQHFSQRRPPHPARLIHRLQALVFLPMIRVKDFTRSLDFHVSLPFRCRPLPWTGTARADKLSHLRPQTAVSRAPTVFPRGPVCNRENSSCPFWPE